MASGSMVATNTETARRRVEPLCAPRETSANITVSPQVRKNNAKLKLLTSPPALERPAIEKGNRATPTSSSGTQRLAARARSPRCV